MKYDKILMREMDGMTCAYTPQAGWKTRNLILWLDKKLDRFGHAGIIGVEVDLLFGLRWVLMKYGPSIRVVSVGIQVG